MRYYSTQRPVAPGTFPKPAGNRVLQITNFDSREFVPEILKSAWGFIEYEKPLTERDARSYELCRAEGVYMNLETGELLTRREMLEQFEEQYDGDQTNVVGWKEYYEEVQVNEQ